MSQPSLIDKILTKRNLTRDALVPNEENLVYDYKNHSAGKRLYIDGILSNKSVGILYDVDVDGVYSGKMIHQELQEMGMRVKYTINKDKEHGMNKGVLSWVRNHDIDFLIVVDAGVGDKAYYEELTREGRSVLVLDHHPATDEDLKTETNLVIISSHYDGSPNKEVSGAFVVYNFIKYVNKELGRKTKDYYKSWVGLTVLSDSCSMLDKTNLYYVNYLYENYQRDNLFKEFTSFGSLWNMFSFTIIPLINSLIRMEDYVTLFKLINPTNKVATVTSKAYAEQTKLRQKELVDELLPQVTVYEGLGVNIGEIEGNPQANKVRGLIANKFLTKYNKAFILVVRNGDHLKASFRGSDNFTKSTLIDLGILAEGHERASGVQFSRDTYEEEKEKILSHPVTKTPKFTDLLLEEREIKDHTTEILRLAELNEYSGKGFEKITLTITNIKDKPVLEKGNNISTYNFANYKLVDFDNTGDLAIPPEELETVEAYPVLSRTGFTLVRL